MQNLIVILIGIIVFGYVGWKIFKTLTRKPSPADKCIGCNGCALKVNTHYK
jgi:nitrate/TMAO reductase-like tetraheme cytochrome c subunit